MSSIHTKGIFFAILILLFVLLVAPIAGATAGNAVTIEYSGNGGGYIGDMYFFSGRDAPGSTILLKITGPGLSADGLPIYDLNGATGTGTPVEVGQDGIWKFLWYSGATVGKEKLQTARYTIIAEDASHPEMSAATSVFIKKPEFYATLQPNPAGYGHYVTLTGDAERGVDYVQIDVNDSSGNTCRTFMAPVGADGYFQYGFHADVPPGQYTVKISNPSLQSSLVLTLAIQPPEENVTPTGAGTPVGVTTGTETTTEKIPTTTAPAKKPFLPLSPIIPISAVAIAGFAGILINRRRSP